MPTLQEILKSCSHQLPRSHQQKVIVIDQKLSEGTHYQALGGKYIVQSKSYVRFRIGRSWRLVYLLTDVGLEPHCLITRQKFDQLLKRRRKHH